MKVIFVFIFLCVLVTTSMSLDDKCNMEECVPISSCPIFNKLLRKNIMYPDDVNLLNSRKCWKTVDGQIFVCCKENKGFNETTTSVPTDPHNGNIETRTDVEAAPHFDHIEIKANVPAEPKCGNHGFSKNLIGGNLTSFDDYPWTALIQYTYPDGEKGFHCGGVLISDQHVLTSSNCVNGKAITAAGYKLTGVRLGDWQLSTERDCDQLTNEIYCAELHRDFVVKETFSHENYDPQSINQHNDIALLTLSEKITKFTKFISPICLPMKESERTYNLTGFGMSVAGWGLTIDSEGSDIKYKHYVKEVSNEECQSTYTSASVDIIPSQICVTGGIYQNSCTSQSGEPLMSLDISSNYHWYVVGVMSFGSTLCDKTSPPEVYTRVDHYIDWIASKMNY